MTELIPTCENFANPETLILSDSKPLIGRDIGSAELFTTELAYFGFPYILRWPTNQKNWEMWCPVANRFVAEKQWTIFGVNRMIWLVFSSEIDAIRFRLLTDSTQ